MQPEEITALFDQQAASYDQQWSLLAAINGALHLLTNAILSKLPPDAHLLCVGSGTGAEILHLAKTFPHWRFTAVEPSASMQEVFRGKADEQGILTRCTLHTGYLDTLPPGEPFDAATSILVSQFITDPALRSGFFQQIASRLKPGGTLITADLSGDLTSEDGLDLLAVWFHLMSTNGITPEALERIRQAYTRDVGVLPPAEVADILRNGGFEKPILFFQSGLIHAWYATL